MNSRFKKNIGVIHLWLGLSSGLVVLIVGLTGCILAFEHEIRSYTEPYQYVNPIATGSQDAAFLLPSQLITIAERQGKKITAIQYRGAEKSAVLSAKGVQIYMNPYSGEVLKEKIIDKDFFRIVLAGHFYLWLPPKIGQPLVASMILVFVVLLITGLILWWPRRWNKANRKKSFTIKWDARFKRVNYDLHNVLGFYAMLICLVLALTGLFYGFQWVQKTLYWTTSGGKSLPKIKRPLSDTTISMATYQHPEDVLWIKAQKEYDLSGARFQISFPAKSADPFTTNFNPDLATFHKREFRYYDQKTLQELKGQGIWTQKYENASAADKLHRMNYDIHVGAMWGLPGKILMFFGSLIAASLPVTGFLIWRGRRKKKKRDAAAALQHIASKSQPGLSYTRELQPN
jgi:uncharacterized iron-regulated membrane protein